MKLLFSSLWLFSITFYPASLLKSYRHQQVTCESFSFIHFGMGRTLRKLPQNEYCNDRFQFCVSYPSGLIKAKSESDNRDGKIFLNNEGLEVMRVFGRNNLDGITLKSQYQSDLMQMRSKGIVISYSKLAGNFYVISGKEGKITFYQKTLSRDGAFIFGICKGRSSEQALFKLLSVSLFSSLK